MKSTTRPKKRGVDLAQVERLAALGFSSIAEVARHMRVPGQRMTGGTTDRRCRRRIYKALGERFDLS